MARNSWFHILERFPLGGRISRKTVFFLGYFRVPCFCPAYGSREMFCDAYTVSIPSWTSHRFILPGWLLLKDIPFSSYPPPNVFPNVFLCHGISNGDSWMPIFVSNMLGVSPSDRRFAVVYLNPLHILVLKNESKPAIYSTVMCVCVQLYGWMSTEEIDAQTEKRNFNVFRALYDDGLTYFYNCTNFD